MEFAISIFVDFGELELHRVMPNESYTKPKLLPKLYHMLWYKSGITQKRHKKSSFKNTETRLILVLLVITTHTNGFPY